MCSALAGGCRLYRCGGCYGWRNAQRDDERVFVMRQDGSDGEWNCKQKRTRPKWDPLLQQNRLY